MARWLTFTRERFPIGTYSLVVGGISFSALFLNSTPDLWSNLTPDLAYRLCLSVLGLSLFFYQLRLMDELKDFKKDSVANPTRPLPRGLLSLPQVSKMINILQIAMFLFSIALVLAGLTHAGTLYAATAFWLFLMFREFFVGAWLSAKPLIYAISHQVICMPLAAFSVMVFSSTDFQGTDANLRTVLFGLQVLSGFFLYEVCRKLNPNSHPILGTYFVHFGYQRTGWVVSVLGVFLVAVNALLHKWIGLSSAALVVPLVLGYWLFMNSLHAARRYKYLELLASILLLHQLWSVALLIFTSVTFTNL